MNLKEIEQVTRHYREIKDYATVSFWTREYAKQVISLISGNRLDYKRKKSDVYEQIFIKNPTEDILSVVQDSESIKVSYNVPLELHSVEFNFSFGNDLTGKM